VRAPEEKPVAGTAQDLPARRARVATAIGAPAGAGRAQAVAELHACDDATLAALVDTELARLLVTPLGSPSRSEQRAAAESIAPLARRAPELARALDDALVSTSQRLRWGAAFTIARAQGDPPRRLWPAAREAMNLPDGDQRWAACELACRLARVHPEVLEGLRTSLGDDSPVLRRMALYALRELRPRELGQLARDRLADADPGVRLAALSAIVDAPGATEECERSADAVAAVLCDDPSPGVRRAAAAALGRLAAPSVAALAALDAAAASSDASLARAARDAAARLRGPSTIGDGPGSAADTPRDDDRS
jgi:HEAT repeats/HEAT repeat